MKNLLLVHIFLSLLCIYPITSKGEEDSKNFTVDEIKPLLEKATSHPEVMNMLDADPTYQGLQFSGDYEKQMDDLHFELRSMSRFNASFVDWCDPAMCMFTAAAAVIGGDDVYKKYTGSEAVFEKKLKELNTEVNNVIKEAQTAGNTLVQQRIQEGTYSHQLQTVIAQLQYCTDEKNLVRKNGPYHDFLGWVMGMSLVFNEFITCDRGAMNDALKGMGGNYFTISGKGPPSEEEFQYFKEIGSNYMFSGQRAYFVGKFYDKLEARRAQLEKWNVLLLARKRYFELLLASINSLANTGQTTGTSTYSTPNFASDTYNQVEMQTEDYAGPEQGSVNQWPLNYQVQMPYVDAFADINKDAQSVQSKFNTYKNVAKLEGELHRIKKLATKRVREKMNDGSLNKILDDVGKLPLDQKTKVDESLARMNNITLSRKNRGSFMNMGKSSSNDKPLLSKDGSKPDIKENSDNSQIAKSPVVQPIAIPPKVKLDTRMVKREKEDEEKLERLAAQKFIEEHGQGDVSEDTTESLFDIIHQRYLKSVKRIF